MKNYSVLRERLIERLQVDLNVSTTGVELRRPVLEVIADDLLDAIAAATPAEITEEGTYLLGSSHLWVGTQGTKATEHMVLRITAADQIVRSRLEKELADLRADIERYNVRMVADDALRSRLTGHSWSSKAVMEEVLAVMERQD